MTADYCDTHMGETADPECETCERLAQEEHAYWRAYFGKSVADASNARRALGLPTDATDAEVCEAARGLK